MSNPNNLGIFAGKLGADPVFFDNADGSRKVKISVYAQNNYKNNDGSTGSVRASFEAFIDAQKAANNNGVYGLMHKGDFISVTYEIKNNDYTNKAGEKVYEEVKQITNVMLNESKATTTARQAARAASDAAAQANG